MIVRLVWENLVHRFWRVWFPLPLAASFLFSGCAQAPQTRAPPPQAFRPVTRSDVTSPVTLDQWGAFLGLGYLLTDEAQTATGVEKTEHLLRGGIGLGGKGSVYSPNFMLYELMGAFGPIQGWASDRDGDRSDDGQLREVDASIRLFPRRFHPTTLYFSRLQDIRPRLFLANLESTLMRIRGEQLFTFAGGNVRINAERRETEQVQFGLEAPPELDVRETTVGVSGDYRLDSYQTITGSYGYQDVDQRLSERSFSAHRFNGRHTLQFGDIDQYELRSRVEGRVQDGDLDQRLFRWNEIFDAGITDRLDGDLEFLYESNRTSFLDQENIRGEAGLQHRLYESLTSTLRGHAGVLTVNDRSTTDTLGGDLGLNYRKHTPAGVLRLNYTGTLERRINENAQGGAVDEEHTFPAAPPEEIRLNSRGIVRDSIVVTDPTGIIVYREGLDYTVAQDAALITTLRRLFTGTIPLQGTVLVDYVFDIGIDFTLDTMINQFRAEHEFDGGITPYFSMYLQDQWVDERGGVGLVVPVIERRYVLGTEWRQARYLVGGEYETRDSTILPFDAVRLRARGSWPLGGGHQATGSGTQTWFFYKKPERDVAITQGTAGWRYGLVRNADFWVDGAIYYYDDELQGTSFGYAFSGGVEYRWRGFSFRLRAAHRETYATQSRFHGTTVGLWIVRNIGAPPPKLSHAIDRFKRR